MSRANDDSDVLESSGGSGGMHAILAQLPYLNARPSEELEAIVASIVSDPVNSSAHQELECYLFQALLAQPADSSELQADVQRCRETLQGLVQVSYGYLPSQSVQGSQRAQTPRIQVQLDALCAQTQEEVIGALNRATLKLREKDEQLLQLKRAVEESAAAVEQLRNEAAGLREQVKEKADAQLFNELAAQEMFNVQVPSQNKTFLQESLAKTSTERRSITELLAESLGLLSEAVGRRDLAVEQALQPPVSYIREKLSEAQLNMIMELQRIASGTLALRYAISSCLEPVQQPGEDRGRSQNKEQNEEDKNARPDKNTLQILKALFQMTLWPEQRFVSRGFGAVGSQELLKLLESQETTLPEGLFEARFVADLNDLARSGDVGEETRAEKIGALLADWAPRLRLLPAVCGDLSKISLALEGRVKELEERAKGLEKSLADSAEKVRALERENAEKLSLLDAKERRLGDLEEKARELQTKLTNAQMNSEQTPHLHEQIVKLSEQTEKALQERGIAEARLQVVQQEASQLQQKLAQMQEMAKAQVIELKQRDTQIRDMDAEAKELGAARQDVLRKNKELVALCKGMEAHIREQELEIQSCKRLIGSDMPLLQERLEKDKTVIQQLQNELQDCQNERRRAVERVKDLEISGEKLERQNASLREENEALGRDARSAQKQARDVTEEIERLTQLYVQEQQKSQLLGENLDRVADRNAVVEQQITEQRASLETQSVQERRSNQEKEALKAQLSALQETYGEVRRELQETQRQYLEESKAQAAQKGQCLQQSLESQMQQQTVRQLETQLEQEKRRAQADIDAKQQIINELTGQVSRLTMVTHEQESRVAQTVRTQYDMQLAGIVQTQQETFQEKTLRLEDDNRLLLAEVQGCRLELTQARKQLADAQEAHAQASRQLTDMEEAQQQLAQKAQRLLKTTNQLKQRLFVYLRTMERLAVQTSGAVSFGLPEGLALSQNAQDVQTLSMFQAPDELHAAELLRAPVPTELQLKQMCDIIQRGLRAGDAELEKDQLQTQVRVLREEARVLQEEIRRAREQCAQVEAEKHQLKAANDAQFDMLQQAVRQQRASQQENVGASAVAAKAPGAVAVSTAANQSFPVYQARELPPQQSRKMKASNLNESELVRNVPLTPLRQGSQVSSARKPPLEYQPLSAEEQAVIENIIRQTSATQPVPVGIFVDK